MRRVLATCVMAFTVFAIIVGSVALLTATSTPAVAAGCGICPHYCLPVTCDNGHVYCNSCLAACAGAGHCTPLFGPIAP